MDTVREFRKRASLTWRRTRVWLALAIPAVLGLAYGWGAETGPNQRFWVFILSFGYLALAIVACTFTVRRYYRCPECEEVVSDSEGGIPLSPRACRHCGARPR